MDELHQWLIRAHGADAGLQLVATAIVEQAAGREQITVTQADIDDEQVLTIKRMVPDAEPSQYETILNQVLTRKQYPRVTWNTMIRRNAYLRKMASRQLKITDEMLTAEWNNRYGLKVQIRLIQCESLADARKILELKAGGESFEDLARKYSMLADLAEVGGLLPPFSRDDRSIPEAIRRAAFDLADGQISEIVRVSGYFNLIQRVKSIPPETDVKFVDVKEQLRRDLSDRLTWQMMERILNDLRMQSDVVWIDPLLTEQVRQAEARSTTP